MIIHSVVDPELIWQQPQPAQLLKYQTLNGMIVETCMRADGSSQVNRIISSDPRNYMAAQWQPGANFDMQDQDT